MQPEGNKLAELVSSLASEKKAIDILTMDLRKIDYVADYFVIASGDSYVQVKAIADHIEEKLSGQGVRVFHREQDKGYNWILLDYSDVVVHVFEQSARKFYSLERLWGDAKLNEFKEKGKYAEKNKRHNKKRFRK